MKTKQDKAKNQRSTIPKFSVENFNQKLEFFEMHQRSKERLREKGIYDLTKMQITESLDEDEFN